MWDIGHGLHCLFTFRVMQTHNPFIILVTHQLLGSKGEIYAINCSKLSLDFLSWLNKEKPNEREYQFRLYLEFSCSS